VCAQHSFVFLVFLVFLFFFLAVFGRFVLFFFGFFELDEAIPVVLAAGGSQGARSINEAMAETIRAFSPDEVQFIWIAGQNGIEMARKAAESASTTVKIFSFTEAMPIACAAADILVSRAGASTTAEIAALGKPAILVPYPHAAENHQTENARALEEAGAATVLYDADCDGEALTGLLRELLDHPEQREAMAQAAGQENHPLAAEAVVERVMELVFDVDKNSEK